MKIRNGFVSNSSSSSFVTIGFLKPIEKYNLDLKKHLTNKFEFDKIKKQFGDDFDTFDDVWDTFLDFMHRHTSLRIFKEDDGIEKGKFFIGAKFLKSDPMFGMETTIVSKDILDEYKKKLNDIGIDGNEIKLCLMNNGE